MMDNDNVVWPCSEKAYVSRSVGEGNAQVGLVVLCQRERDHQSQHRAHFYIVAQGSYNVFTCEWGVTAYKEGELKQVP